MFTIALTWHYTSVCMYCFSMVLAHVRRYEITLYAKKVVYTEPSKNEKKTKTANDNDVGLNHMCSHTI